jgi:hypothetical protein
MDLLANWPRWSRRILAVVLILAALVLLVRLILDPLATALARRELQQMKGMRGEFERLHVTVFPPGYAVTRLKLIEVPGGRWEAPLFYADRTEMQVDWRRLFHAELVARARIIEPKIVVFGGESKGGKPVHAPDVAGELRGLTRLKIDRVEVHDGQILFRDVALPHHPELWVHDLDAAAENLATRQSLTGARPATVAAEGAVGHSGELRVFVSADPFARPLEFAGRFELTGLRAAELYEFIAPTTKLQAGKGTVSLYAEFQAKNGRLDGGVKPVLKNIEVQPTTNGLWKRFEAWLANRGIDVASDRVPERNAVATVVPIEGRITDPDVQLWPAVFGVIRNAFVQGIAGGFGHLPPPEAGEKQGLLEQAKEAASKKSEAPKAQPTVPKDGGGSKK